MGMDRYTILLLCTLINSLEQQRISAHMRTAHRQEASASLCGVLRKLQGFVS